MSIPPPPRPDPSKNPGRSIGGHGCLGLLGMIFGHKYEGRYDLTWPRGNPAVEWATTEGMKALADHTYRGDVCRRCGDVVNEQEARGAIVGNE